MKTTNMVKRAFCMLLSVVMLTCVASSMLVYVSASGIRNLEFVPAGTDGYKDDMIKWEDPNNWNNYIIALYDSNTGKCVGTAKVGSQRYYAVKELAPKSGNYYFDIVARRDMATVGSSVRSEVFTYKDTTAPEVGFYDDAQRLSDSVGSVIFRNGDFIGVCTYYYTIVESGAPIPKVDTSGKGISANIGNNTLNLNDLTPGAKDIYLILKDEDGNESIQIMTTIPEYDPLRPLSLDIYEMNRTGVDTASLHVKAGADGKIYYTFADDFEYINPPSKDSGTWYSVDCPAGEVEVKIEHLPSDDKTLWCYLKDSLGNTTPMDSTTGWYPINNEYLFPSEYEINGGGEVTITSSIPLNGVECIARLYENQEELPEKITVSGSGTTWTATLPDRTAEYVFEGSYGEYDRVSCIVKVYAKEGYTVILKANGGGGTDRFELKIIGEYPLPQNPFVAPESKIFKGWSTTPTADGIIDTDTYNITADTALYAIWSDCPQNLHWNGKVAEWDVYEGAEGYHVRLYKKDISFSFVSKIVSEAYYDFSSFRSHDDGIYYFTVQAINSKEKSEIATSDSIMFLKNGKTIQLNGSTNISIGAVGSTALIMGRDDIAKSSVSQIDLSGFDGATSLIIDQDIVSADSFDVTTGQGLGISYSYGAWDSVMNSVGLGNALGIGSELNPSDLPATLEPNETAVASFSLSTYSISPSGDQTYIPVRDTMNFTVPVDESKIPKNAKLKAYLINEDGSREQMEVLSIENGKVNVRTNGNSDYLLVYEIENASSQGSPSVGIIVAISAVAAVVIGTGITAVIILLKKKKTN